VTRTVEILAAVAVVVVLAIICYIYISKYHQAFYATIRQAISLISDSGTLKILLLYLQTTSSLNNIWPEWALR
jgi:hypothetical protein